MKPDVERLHVAARRYCIDRFELWAEKYQRLIDAGLHRKRTGYTQEAYRTFPRYQVIKAIRTDLERLTGTDIASLDEARELFALAGLTAHDVFTASLESEAQVAVRDERDAFVRFVREVSSDALSTLQPLPYTRVLNLEEAEQVWGSVERAWGLRRRRYWYPLAKSEQTDVEGFQAPCFQRAVSSETVAAILAIRGITRVWELRESSPDYELDVSALDLQYDGDEAFWTSPALDWITYASHESSITVGGWVLAEIKRRWPEWESHIWKTPIIK